MGGWLSKEDWMASLISSVFGLREMKASNSSCSFISSSSLKVNAIMVSSYRRAASWSTPE